MLRVQHGQTCARANRKAVNAMLLNEFLKKHRKVESREKQVESLLLA